MRGAYPGTFDPPTIAHLAIAEAALSACALERIDLIVNRRPIGKGESRDLEMRLAMLEAVATSRPWLGVVVSDHELIVDQVVGYDVLVLGADKWAQVVDPSYYASEADCAAAVARLPRLAVARRNDFTLPRECTVLDVDLPDISSTAARGGRIDLVVPEARPFVDQ